MRAQPREPLRIVQRVDLVGDDEHRLVLELLAGGVPSGKERQLLHDHVEVLDRFATARGRDVDQVDEHLGPFEVAEESMAEAMTRVRAFDQPGHVRHDERPLAGQADDAEVGAERGEGIVGDLRPRRRDAGDHRRLPGVGEADQPDVGEQLQMEPELLFLAGQARLGAARRAIGGRGELGVAAAADAALGDQEPLSRGRQIGDLHQALVLLFVDDGADRHLELDVGALPPGAVRAFAVSAAVGGEFLLEAEIEKGIEVGVAP